MITFPNDTVLVPIGPALIDPPTFESDVRRLWSLAEETGLLDESSVPFFRGFYHEFFVYAKPFTKKYGRENWPNDVLERANEVMFEVFGPGTTFVSLGDGSDEAPSNSDEKKEGGAGEKDEEEGGAIAE